MRFFVLLVFLGLTACGGDDSSSNGGTTPVSSLCGSGASGIPSAQKSESSYCASRSGGAVNFTGVAQYEYRSIDSNGLLDNPSTLPTRKIRFAEVIAYLSSDSAKTPVACDETDANGNFSLNLPNDGQSYVISVNSRGANSTVNASVLDCPNTNDFHALTTTVTASSGGSVGTLTAEGRNTVLGGAFHILDMIVFANQFIATSTAGCTTTPPTATGDSTIACSPYVANATLSSGRTSKVTAYWTKGFNPNEFFNNASSGLSFYLPSDDSLFILGGISGDTDNSDTDHFDASVILHEYGHFLEDQYATSDSPGGSHDGNSVLDPRLTWSEGWANYFQAVVLEGVTSPPPTPFYTDTSGNKDGTASSLFHQNLEFRCPGAGSTNDGTVGCADRPTSIGEGNFREFSISRVLWDITDSNADTFSSPAQTDSVQLAFEAVWTTFLNFPDTDFAFRNIGLFHEITLGLSNASVNATTYNNLVNGTRQQPNRLDYANPIDSSTSCTTTFTSSGTNLLNAHDFYDLTHSGGALTLELTYSPNNSANDADLILYREQHVLNDASTVAGVSDGTTSQESPRGTETITFSSLAAGRYLIDAHYFAGTAGQEYTLRRNGTKICPKTSF